MLATCSQQVVRVGFVEIGERHDARTDGQHNPAADRRPTNQASAWQAAERRNRLVFERHEFESRHGHRYERIFTKFCTAGGVAT